MTNEQKINQIKARIATLEGRQKDNAAIVRKLKRKLKLLDNREN